MPVDTPDLSTVLTAWLSVSTVLALGAAAVERYRTPRCIPARVPYVSPYVSPAGPIDAGGGKRARPFARTPLRRENC